MANATRVTFSNHKQVRKALNELETALQDRARKDIAVAGGKVVRAEAKVQVPVGPTGNLKRSIFLSRSRRKTGPQAYVGARAPHSKLVEYGTRGLRYPTAKARKIKPGGGWVWSDSYITHTGRMPANPFMRRSIDKTETGCHKAMENELENVIKKYMK